MFLVGICLHIIFLFSIFDIYFKSPVVNNVAPYQPQHAPLADRLVLFIVDGLRAESFINYTTMDYLRSVANTQGRWGISHTQVPTESRPGHVAVIAGFYEDPSAVAKGWKENPVDFDSVFNQTMYTWCWGTYDILEIFTKSHIDDHIYINKFNPYDHSFSTDKNTTLLDKWVFDNVKQFFVSAQNDDVIKLKLQNKKIMFFLHLLGTDTSGHTHKPRTENFLTTIKFVDEGIKEIEKVIRNYYNDDGRTTFIMTSDHGMTDWGSHGAGDDHETQTPFVIWGSGINITIPKHVDPTTNGMYIENRLDINQASLTPLMSTILSIPVPVNSIGQLRTELLNMSLPDKAKAVYSNSRQLASQYNKKRYDIETNAISLLYKPYEPFDKDKYEQMIQTTEKLLKNEEYENLITLSEQIMELSLSGLKYYHNYYQNTLLLLVTLSFMGWIMCLLTLLVKQNINTQIENSGSKKYSLITENSKNKIYLNMLFSLMSVSSLYAVYAQNLQIQYYLYFLTPIFLWWYTLSSLEIWMQLFLKLNRRDLCFHCFEALLYITGCIAMGMSFSYRWMLSIPLLGMSIWPFCSSFRHNLIKPVILIWIISCILLSIFSFMPVVGKEVFIELVIAAGTMWLIIIILYQWKLLLKLPKENQEIKKEIYLTLIQMCLLVVSLQNIYKQSERFDKGTKVSTTDQAVAWIIAVVSLVLPLAFSKRMICRLVAINSSLLNFYLLLSVSHEGLFMVTLIINATCWIFIEFKLLRLENTKIIEYSFDKDDNEENIISLDRSISSQDFRRAFSFTLYIILAFFGTGNIASLNSFEVRWVTCFTTSFQPFIITGLILLKTLTPFLTVACSFRAVQHISKAPTGYLHIIVLIYSNIMGIQLLYYVKNTGSWLDIGTSISQYVIVQVITLFIVVINQGARTLTDTGIEKFTSRLSKSRKKIV